MKRVENWDVIDMDDVVKFMDAACTLESSLVADLKKGKTISSETVLALSHFVKSARLIQPALDAAQKDMLKIN